MGFPSGRAGWAFVPFGAADVPPPRSLAGKPKTRSAEKAMPGNEASGPWRMAAWKMKGKENERFLWRSKQPVCGPRRSKQPFSTSLAALKAASLRTAALKAAFLNFNRGDQSSLSPLPALVAASLLPAALKATCPEIIRGAHSSLPPFRGAYSSLSRALRWPRPPLSACQEKPTLHPSPCNLCLP